MKDKIFYCKPSICEEEIQMAAEAATHAWGDNAYTYVRSFETSFRNYLGVNYSIATSSCTGALHMGLSALGIGPGDEVILADINWIATVSPICHLQAKPVFVDISPETWCLDPEKVKEAITPRTKAIIATHIYGNLCDMNALLEISAAYNIPLIEDAAEAIGSVYHGNKAGSMGIFSVFSFHGSKTITTGEGGMFATSNHELYEKVLTLSNHGRSKNQKKQFWPETIGFKYKMSDVQAAIGCAQMQKIDQLVDRKREILNYYKKHLDLQMNPEKSGELNGAWMPTVVFENNNFDLEKLLSFFSAENIDARVFFHPLTSLNMFEHKPSNVHSYDISSRAINLPSYYDMTFRDQDRVIEVCNKFKKVTPKKNALAC